VADAKEAIVRALVPGLLLLLAGCSAQGDRLPTEEEIVAPLLIENGCWGGVVRYDAHERKFTVDDTVCSDARFYHLEFSHDLRLIEKTVVAREWD
jgi:hypothetical protein